MDYESLIILKKKDKTLTLYINKLVTDELAIFLVLCPKEIWIFP